MNIELYSLLGNSLITFYCGLYPLISMYNGRLRRHPFFFLSSLGMVVYGSELFLRFVGLPLGPIIYFVTSLAYILYTLGLWSLSTEKRLLYYIIVSYAVSLFIILFFVWPTFSLNLFFFISILLIVSPIIVLLIYHRALLGKISDKFQFGWYLLLFTNFIFPGKGWISDLFAIFAKIMILMGMFDHEFFFLSRRLYESKINPISTTYRKEGKIYMIHHSVNEKWKTGERVRELINQSMSDDKSIYIFSFQDVTSHAELWRLKWIDPERIHVLLFSSSAERASREFELTPMDLTKISAMLTAVTKIKGSMVIFMNLSHLIHTFGWGSVYKMISDKLGALREGEIEFYAFLYPETHSDKTVINLFTHISD